jgi:putative transposase
MGRPRRSAEGGQVYHVLNRARGRVRIFREAADYEAFVRVLAAAVGRTRTRLLAFCVTPNHWHLVVWPHEDGELSRFTGWLTLTHAQRWHAHRGSTGSGHVYQGRFKSFVIQDDDHVLTACRYVERNALRAKLVERAEHWPWGSLHHRFQRSRASRALLSPWPVARPADWIERVNAPQTAAELAALRLSARRGNPFGDAGWVERMVRRLGLQSTLRPTGRPRKRRNGS